MKNPRRLLVLVSSLAFLMFPAMTLAQPPSCKVCVETFLGDDECKYATNIYEWESSFEDCTFVEKCRFFGTICHWHCEPVGEFCGNMPYGVAECGSASAPLRTLNVQPARLSAVAENPLWCPVGGELGGFSAARDRQEAADQLTPTGTSR